MLVQCNVSTLSLPVNCNLLTRTSLGVSQEDTAGEHLRYDTDQSAERMSERGSECMSLVQYSPFEF